MKRLLLLLLLLTPLATAAQWSIVPSVGVGSTKMDSNIWKSTEGKLSYSASATARYSFGMFFASTGLGYQEMKVKFGRSAYAENADYLNSLGSLKYSDIHIPISVGFQYSKTRLYPIAEAGLIIAFPMELKDMINAKGGILCTDGDAKSIALTYFAKAGIGYAFTHKLALEAKLSYTKTGNVNDYKYPAIPSDDAFYTNPSIQTKWQSIGAQVSLAIKL